MTNKSNILRIFGIGFALAGSILIAGSAFEAKAQGRDPFQKPGYMKQKPSAPVGGRVPGKGTDTTVTPGAPSIEQRIEYYKRLREQAALSGAPLPKVTSVLTLNEMAVTGIFHTPRGYAAMVEAVPIKLSYTIYPGERFFDGQLVAVEENHLVFRRVTKTGKGKFTSSIENKTLRQYSTKSVVEGTAAGQGNDASMQQASTQTSAGDSKEIKPEKDVQIVSPLDEMTKQPQDSEKSDKSKSAKAAKKPAEVAKNK